MTQNKLITPMVQIKPCVKLCDRFYPSLSKFYIPDFSVKFVNKKLKCVSKGCSQSMHITVYENMFIVQKNFYKFSKYF